MFLFQVLPSPPLHFIKQLESIIFDFIWSGNPDKVKRSTLINEFEAGGLKAPHLHSFIRGLKCSWVKRYTDNNDALWKIFFDHYLKPYGKDFLFHCNFSYHDVSITNDFINDVCKAWSYYAFKNPRNDFKNQIIWNNSFIKVDKRIVFFKKMYENGIVFVKDLYDEENSLLSIGNLIQTFSLHSFPFTLIHSVIDAIPISWKGDIYPLDNDSETPFKCFCEITSVSQHVCRSLVNDISTPPTSINKWEREFNFSNDQWKSIFKIPFYTLSETKLQYFQFRFLHRLLGTNHLLYSVFSTGPNFVPALVWQMTPIAALP